MCRLKSLERPLKKSKDQKGTMSQSPCYPDGTEEPVERATNDKHNVGQKVRLEFTRSLSGTEDPTLESQRGFAPHKINKSCANSKETCVFFVERGAYKCQDRGIPFRGCGVELDPSGY